MHLAIRLLVIGLALAGPVTLRYQYPPGRSLRYQVTEQAETSQQIGSQPAVTTEKQQTTTLLSRRVLSVTNGIALVEERRAEGRIHITRPEGDQEKLTEPSTQRLTLTARGQCLKTETRAAPGTARPGQQFLEGLSFPLPEKAIAPGAQWNGLANTVGPDGKPLRVRFTSRYAGNTSRSGHPCAQIVTNLTGDFRLPTGADTPPLNGALTGFIVSYLARDIGQDIYVDARLKLALTGQAKTPDGPQKATRTTSMRITQTLLK